MLKERAYEYFISKDHNCAESVLLAVSEEYGLGIGPEEAEEKFGFLLEAFRYGVPPHGGLAFGLDRVVCLLLGLEDIRDVIAFPKVQNASELLSKAPAPADPKALEELGIAVVKMEEDE